MELGLVEPESNTISIHALREEGDSFSLSSNGTVNLFLSTPSARRATLSLEQYPIVSVISIHALREEGDSFGRCSRRCRYGFLSTPSARRATMTYEEWAERQNVFLSTPSARRATHDPLCDGFPDMISIHALREEGDVAPCGGNRPGRYFYPRPPRGGRLGQAILAGVLRIISIHALREEGDLL